MVTLNAEDLLHRSLKSVSSIADEIIVIDSGSTDSTLMILKDHSVNLFKTKNNHLGRNKAKALALATGDLVLSLDSDEIVSAPLIRSIELIKRRKNIADGYIIPFRNHYLGKRLRYGGENYSMVRLGKRKKLQIKQVSVHESVVVNSKNIARLESPILHYSYRSLNQMFHKFTSYALNEAREKSKVGERSSLKKMILYPMHMFWARFIKDKGYKDGLFRIPLDIGFAYMEFITYTALAIRNKGL